MQAILADQAYVSGQRKDDVHINTRARMSPQLQGRREAMTETWKGIHGRNDNNINIKGRSRESSEKGHPATAVFSLRQFCFCPI